MSALWSLLSGLDLSVIVGAVGIAGAAVWGFLQRRAGARQERNDSERDALKRKVRSNEIRDEVESLPDADRRAELDKWLRSDD